VRTAEKSELPVRKVMGWGACRCQCQHTASSPHCTPLLAQLTAECFPSTPGLDADESLLLEFSSHEFALRIFLS